MYTPDNWDPLDRDNRHVAHLINNDAPKLNFYADETRMANPALMKKVFPNTVAPWFNELPASLRLILGTKKFDREYLKYACGFCAHPVKKSHYKCSFCKGNLNLDDVDLNEVIDGIKIRYTDHHDEEEELRTLDKVNTFISMCTIKLIYEKVIEIEGIRWDLDCSSLDEQYLDGQPSEEDEFEI